MIKKTISLMLCIVLCLMCSSCANKSKEDSIPKEISASFNSVGALKTALKNDPHKYNGKRVSVKGYADTLFEENSGVTTYVTLFDDLPADDELLGDRPRIKVVITDSVKLAVLEDGDYISLDGVVKISSDEIYMDHCTYTMAFKALTYTGKGSKAIKNIVVPNSKFILSGYAKTDNGKVGSFYVDLTDSHGKRVLYWNTYVTSDKQTVEKAEFFNGPINGGILEIQSDDNVSWTITIEAVG